MINCESDLGTHPGPVTTDLQTLAITFLNGDTEKENSSLHMNDGKRETLEACLLLRTEEVQEKLCSRMQDKMDLQKNIGLSESNTNDEKISDETKVTTTGGSKTCTEKGSFRTEIIQGRLCSVILDKMDIQKSVGLSESNTSDEKISDETKVTTTGGSKTCTEKGSFRTEIIQGRLCSVILDKMDIQKSVGLSELNTSDEKISDGTKVTTTGESKTCTEKDSFRTEIIQGKLVSRIHDNMDIQKSVGLSESGANDEKNSDKTDFTAMGESETCLEAGILRTEEAEGKLCSRTQDKMDSQESSGLGDTSGEKICDVTNVTTTGENKTCLEMNENKCKKIESNGKEGLKDAAQSAGLLGNELEKQISDCDPVPDGRSTAEVYCMPSAGADTTCGTKVNLTSTANWCQKSTANLNGSLQSGKASEVNRSANNHGIAASSLVVIKSKNDFTVSRPSSGTASNKTFRPVARLLHDVGLDLVTEWVCQDLINIQTQTTTISPLPEAEKTRQLSVLAANKQRLTKKNKAYAFRKRQCTCGFRSESRIVLAFHSQFGDASRNGDRCCLCSFIAQQPRYFVRHMKRRHKLKALVTAKGAQYQCHFCPFENNHQLRLEGHLAKCCKLFDLNVNLCPVRMDSDIPVFVAPKPLLIGDVQAKQSTVTSAAAPANHVFAAGGKPSQIPLHSSIPSCSLIIQQPQECATIPSSVTFSLPLTRFIVTPSAGPVMPRIQFSVVPPKSQNSAKPCSVVSPVVSPSLLPVVTPSQQLALPPATRSSLQTNMIISPSHRGFVLPTNFAQNLSQTGLTIPPLVGKDAPQSLLGVPSSVTLVRPEPCLLVPPSLRSDLLRMQLLASPQAPIVQFQNPTNTSGAETRFIQVGNQMCTIVQHQGRCVLTPLIFPRQILPLTPSFTLNSPLSSNRQAVSSGRQDVIQNSAQLSSGMLSSSISLPRDTVNFVRMPNLQPPTNTNRLSFGLEICELCDGFVKDRQSLSVHFRNAHKVSFMTEDLNCVVPSQTCSLCWQSFFTISGLLRHYHLLHASDSRLVKPLERCSLCKNINLKNAVEHLSSHHHDVMSKSHEFKQCGICPLHLRDVQSFEKHMLLVHDNLFANRNILLATIAASLPDKTRWVGDSNPPGLNGQPKECSKKPGKTCHTCRSCGTTHSTAEELSNHTISNHMHKCSRCQEAFNSLPSLRRHFHMKHSTEREVCPLCLKSVQIGRPFIRHMKSQHLKDCCVRIERMHNSNACGNQAKRRTIDSDNLVNCSAQQTNILVDNGSLKYDDDLSSQSAKKLKLESDHSSQK